MVAALEGTFKEASPLGPKGMIGSSIWSRAGPEMLDVDPET